MDPFNIGAELIERNLREGRGQNVAIWSGGKTLTYERLSALVDRTGAAFLKAGVRPEQRVLMVMPDTPELAACYLAAMKIGAVAVPCNPLLRTADYAYFLEESRAALVVTAAALVEKLPRHDRRMLVTGVDFEKAVAEVPEGQKLAAAQTHKDEAAFWLWTSGSTGKPKAAVHAHQDWPHCCELYGRTILKLSPRDRCYSASKLFHAYGLGNALAFPFWVGASAILSPDRPAPDVVWRNIAEGRPTIFFGVPTLYAAMLQTQGSPDVASLRVCVSAGEPLPGDLFSRWKSRFGTEILDGIGSTEVLHIYVSPRMGEAKPGSTGLPVDGYQVRVVDELGQDVRRGETGDLVVKGASTALFYWNRKDQSRQKMRGEWFFSGDKFRQTEDGEFHYVGRSDDMFKSAGEWISPADVEAAIISHSAVLECAVVAMRLPDGLLRPRAHVVLVQGKSGSTELAEELKTHVRGKCAGYMVPREIVFATELPKTATGKIQRFLLRDADV